MSNRFEMFFYGSPDEMDDCRLESTIEAIHTLLRESQMALHMEEPPKDKVLTEKEHWELWDRMYALTREKERRKPKN